MSPNPMMLPEPTGLPNTGSSAPPALNAPQMGGRRRKSGVRKSGVRKSGRRKSGVRKSGRRRTSRRMRYN